MSQMNTLFCNSLNKFKMKHQQFYLLFKNTNGFLCFLCEYLDHTT